MLVRMKPLQIVGRSSSLFTRMPLIFAEELGVPWELVPIYDMTALGPEVYAGNPALKLPILRTESSVLFGAQNICRAIADRAIAEGVAPGKRVVWPEALKDDLSRNAQELVWHGMNTQVQLIIGIQVNKLPADNAFFVKARAGFEGALTWLDSSLSAALKALPARDLSLFEVSLHCLIEHLTFRATLSVGAYPSLIAFSKDFATRPSAQRTVYRFDTPPA
jgi:glutathione S-transferase